MNLNRLKFQLEGQLAEAKLRAKFKMDIKPKTKIKKDKKNG